MLGKTLRRVFGLTDRDEQKEQLKAKNDGPDFQPDGVEATTSPTPLEHIGPYNVHPEATKFRRMTGEEFEALVEDIKQNGLREKIMLCDGMVLDGRNRLAACLQLGIEPHFESWQGDAASYSRSANLKRRHLSPTERAFLAAEEATLEHGQRADTAGAVSQDQAAKDYGVSVDSIQRARKILSSGCAELIEAARTGKVALLAGAAIAELPQDKQAQALASPEALAPKRRKAKGRRGRRKQRVDPKGPPEPVNLIETETGYRLEVGEGWENQVASAMANHSAFENAIAKGLLIVRKQEGEHAA